MHIDRALSLRTCHCAKVMSSCFVCGVWFHYCMMIGWSVSVDDCVRYRCAAAATSARRGVHWQSLQYWDRSVNVVMFHTKVTTISTDTLIGVARNWSCEGRTKACKAENRGRNRRSGLGYLGSGQRPSFPPAKRSGDRWKLPSVRSFLTAAWLRHYTH